MTADEIRARLPPGLAHARLSGADHRLAAVLVPLEAERGVWLTRRTAFLPSHAGQVSFPGGKLEPDDVSVEAAAVREAREEIGLRAEDAEILGRMDDIVTSTGFHISPVVALLQPGLTFSKAPEEVEEVFCLPFATLLDPAQPRLRTGILRGTVREFFVWPHESHFIWGATAEILRNLARRLRGSA